MTKEGKKDEAENKHSSSSGKKDHTKGITESASNTNQRLQEKNVALKSKMH